MDGTCIIRKTLEQSGGNSDGGLPVVWRSNKKAWIMTSFIIIILPVNSFMNWRLWESEHTL
jgi:hypothetical protein